MAGFARGDYIFRWFFKPYYDLRNLSVYPSVNPDVYYAQAFMDASVVEFVGGSRLDISKSYGFKNGKTYCVAPVLGPAKAEENFTGISKQAYDFWAVGINCCSGHRPDFHCGEYSNPRANKGLRVMHEEEVEYFRLAVQAAGASYNIKTGQPLFLNWVEYPEDEIDAYVKQGWTHFMRGIFGFFGLLVLVVFLSEVAIFVKRQDYI